MARRSEEWLFTSLIAEQVGDIGYNRVLNIAKIWLAAEEPTRLPATPSRLGTFLTATFYFSDEGDDVLRVELEHADPLRGSDIQRIAWSRWLAAARAQRAKALDLEAGSESRSQTLLQAFGAKPPPKHPGRRGHGANWWRALGARVDELVEAEGVANTTRIIAAEMHLPDDEQSLELVRGWIKKARKGGFAKPGRSGRPPKQQENEQ